MVPANKTNNGVNNAVNKPILPGIHGSPTFDKQNCSIPLAGYCSLSCDRVKQCKTCIKPKSPTMSYSYRELME